MKTSPQFDSLLGRLEADVEARIRSLFHRCPALHGCAQPGDTDLNGRVDFADLVHLAQNYGAGEGDRTWFAGDFTYESVPDWSKLPEGRTQIGPTG